MWISREEYDRLVAQLSMATAANFANVRDLATAKATLEWMRVQLNTVQAEKASLLSAVTKQPVLTPTIRPADSSPIAPAIRDAPNTDNLLSQLSAMFEDVGDEAAQQLHIDHDAAGAVVYR